MFWTDSLYRLSIGWIDEVEIIGCWAIIEEDEEEDICDNEDAEASNEPPILAAAVMLVLCLLHIRWRSLVICVVCDNNNK